MTMRPSHWRVLLSAGGPVHVQFLKSDVTDDQVCIYSDDWLDSGIARNPLSFPQVSPPSRELNIVAGSLPTHTRWWPFGWTPPHPAANAPTAMVPNSTGI